MKTTVNVTKCDCCGDILKKRNAFFNNPGYQRDYVEKGSLDVCFNCMGKIFDTELKASLSEEQIAHHLQNHKQKSDSTLAQQFFNNSHP